MLVFVENFFVIEYGNGSGGGDDVFILFFVHTTVTSHTRHWPLAGVVSPQ